MSPPTHTLAFTYPAHIENIDTGETTTDVRLLALLDGIAESTDLAEYALDDTFRGFTVSSARPVLRFDTAQAQLRLEIIYAVDRAPDADMRRQLAAFGHQMIEGSWGCNYEFDLPAELEDHQVHFESTARESLG